LAAEVSGSRVYARALATLVDRRAWGAVGALGATGPRLSDRLRRLVDGEPTMKLTRAGSTTLSLATAVFALLSFAAVAATARPPDDARRPPPRVPYGYSPQQAGAPARLSNLKASPSASPFLFTAVRVRNATEATLRSVTLVAVLEGRGRSAGPAKLIPTGPIAVSLAPGEAADLSLNLVTPTQVDEAEKHFGKPAQSWLAVLRVTFDDGQAWRVVPRDGATKAIDALYLRQTAEVSRRLVSAVEPPVPSGVWGLCMDDAGLQYSPGASAAIRDEPGHFAVCHPSGVFVASPPGGDGSSN
jgi:hypothetical protein